MNRRTALQAVATVFVGLGGRAVHAAQEKLAGSGRAFGMAETKPTALRLALDPDVRLELSANGRIIVIDQDELIAALLPENPR